MNAPINNPSKLFIFLTLAISFGCAVCPARAQSKTAAAKKLSPAEEWVLSQASHGEEADLQTKFPGGDEQRVLSASFLVGLLDNSMEGVKVGRNGVQIKNAIVREPLNLTNLKIPYSLGLESCVFEEEVEFTNTEVDGDFSIVGSTFKKSARFEDLKANDDAFFKQAVFKAEVNLIGANITKNLELDGARFENAATTATFDSMKVNQNVFVRDVIFECLADFIGASVAGSFEIHRTQFKKAGLSASFEDVKAGTMIFDNASFIGQADLGGLTYQRIDGDSDKDPNLGSWQSLIELMDKSVYKRNVYAGLEAFLMKEGYPERADEVYIAQRRRERKEQLTGFSRIGSFLLDVLVGYGRKPWLVLIYSIVIVAIGYFVFRSRAKMEPLKSEDASRHYSPFWYSVDLFAPVINLGAASIWIPKENRKVARNYAHLQRILGWILIPIGLAALTGIIK